MPSLLSLPRELRDQIIDHVMFSLLDAPPAPPKGSSPENFQRKIFDKEPTYLYPKDLIYYPSSSAAYEPTSKGLLQTCHQLRAETLDRRAKLVISSAVLDVMLVEEKSLWPTWLSIPPKMPPIIERLEIRIRICGSPRIKESLQSRVRFGGCISSPIPYGLFGIVDRFLAVGTTGECPPWFWRKYETSVPAYRPQYCIKSLHIVVDTNVALSENEQLSPENIPSRQTPHVDPKTNKLLVVSPMALGIYLADRVEILLGPTGFGYNKLAALLGARIGEVTVSVGKTLVGSLNWPRHLEPHVEDEDWMRLYKIAVLNDRHYFGLG
ncbi:uncharacterized protein BDR25DRAFT_35276 [Lindgomyces ingoldianus]|uniref:Uncharacterized protein n=1 Tax=Lindgomyces ingoldianus TaxID=673940 RepID=A0ACB6QVG6_9PLEO|nr:uncharacterized protein BDR25DRAFT_35276 [Lindgomyces ingoldianus]KAF2470500.1 hypothetical protein BDR25DRAFT_35276 [Lindgomyces ingoldianus]